VEIRADEMWDDEGHLERDDDRPGNGRTIELGMDEFWEEPSRSRHGDDRRRPARPDDMWEDGEFGPIRPPGGRRPRRDEDTRQSGPARRDDLAVTGRAQVPAPGPERADNATGDESHDRHRPELDTHRDTVPSEATDTRGPVDPASRDQAEPRPAAAGAWAEDLTVPGDGRVPGGDTTASRPDHDTAAGDVSRRPDHEVAGDARLGGSTGPVEPADGRAVPGRPSGHVEPADDRAVPGRPSGHVEPADDRAVPGRPSGHVEPADDRAVPGRPSGRVEPADGRAVPRQAEIERIDDRSGTTTSASASTGRGSAGDRRDTATGRGSAGNRPGATTPANASTGRGSAGDRRDTATGRGSAGNRPGATTPPGPQTAGSDRTGVPGAPRDLGEYRATGAGPGAPAAPAGREQGTVADQDQGDRPTQAQAANGWDTSPGFVDRGVPGQADRSAATGTTGQAAGHGDVDAAGHSGKTEKKGSDRRGGWRSAVARLVPGQRGTAPDTPAEPTVDLSGRGATGSSAGHGTYVESSPAPSGGSTPDPGTPDADGGPRVVRRAEPPVPPKVVSTATPPPAPRVIKAEPPVAPRVVAAPAPVPPARVIGPNGPQPGTEPTRPDAPPTPDNGPGSRRVEAGPSFGRDGTTASPAAGAAPGYGNANPAPGSAEARWGGAGGRPDVTGGFERPPTPDDTRWGGTGGRPDTTGGFERPPTPDDTRWGGTGGRPDTTGGFERPDMPQQRARRTPRTAHVFLSEGDGPWAMVPDEAQPAHGARPVSPFAAGDVGTAGQPSPATAWPPATRPQTPGGDVGPVGNPVQGPDPTAATAWPPATRTAPSGPVPGQVPPHPVPGGPQSAVGGPRPAAGFPQSAPGMPPVVPGSPAAGRPPVPGQVTGGWPAVPPQGTGPARPGDHGADERRGLGNVDGAEAARHGFPQAGGTRNGTTADGTVPRSAPPAAANGWNGAAPQSAPPSQVPAAPGASWNGFGQQGPAAGASRTGAAWDGTPAGGSAPRSAPPGTGTNGVQGTAADPRNGFGTPGAPSGTPGAPSGTPGVPSGTPGVPQTGGGRQDGTSGGASNAPRSAPPSPNAAPDAPFGPWNGFGQAPEPQPGTAWDGPTGGNEPGPVGPRAGARATGTGAAPTDAGWNSVTPRSAPPASGGATRGVTPPTAGPQNRQPEWNGPTPVSPAPASARDARQPGTPVSPAPPYAQQPGTPVSPAPPYAQQPGTPVSPAGSASDARRPGTPVSPAGSGWDETSPVSGTPAGAMPGTGWDETSPVSGASPDVGGQVTGAQATGERPTIALPRPGARPEAGAGAGREKIGFPLTRPGQPEVDRPYMDADGTLHNLRPIGRLETSGPDTEPRRYADTAFGGGWFVAKAGTKAAADGGAEDATAAGPNGAAAAGTGDPAGTSGADVAGPADGEATTGAGDGTAGTPGDGGGAGPGSGRGSTGNAGRHASKAADVDSADIGTSLAGGDVPAGGTGSATSGQARHQAAPGGERAGHDDPRRAGHDDSTTRLDDDRSTGTGPEQTRDGERPAGNGERPAGNPQQAGNGTQQAGNAQQRTGGERPAGDAKRAGGAANPARDVPRGPELAPHLPLTSAELSAIRWRLDGATLREVVDNRDALRALGERLDGPLTDEADNIVKAGLLSVRAEVYRLLGELGMAAAASRLALAHAESANDLQSMVIAQAELAHVLRLRGDYMEADRLFQKAVEADVSPAVRSVVHENAGRSCFDQGRHMEALDHFARAIRLGALEDTDLVERIGVCLEAVYIHVLRDGWGPYPRRSPEILTPLGGKPPADGGPGQSAGDAFSETTSEQPTVRPRG
jgi:hypothetical protein